MHVLVISNYKEWKKLSEGNTGLIELRDVRERLIFICLRQTFRQICPRYFDAHKAAEWAVLLIRIWRFQGTEAELYKKYRIHCDAYNVTRADG